MAPIRFIGLGAMDELMCRSLADKREIVDMMATITQARR